MKRNLAFFIVLIFILTIPVVLPYLKSGYFPTHDGEWAVVRLADMYRSFKDLQLPVRYSGYLNSGYGYPLFNFAYPFPYYFALIPLFLGFGFVGSIKFLFLASIPFSVLFMFFLSRKLWKSDLAGLISAVFYLYLPYRFVDLFVRGSIGESLSFVLFPLLFYLVLKMSESKNKLSLLILSAVSFAVLVLTHNIMTVLFTPLFLFFALFLIWQKKGNERKMLIKSIILVIVIGILLSTFFWFPALFEKNLIKLSQIPIADRNLYFVSLQKLILPSWGYAPPTDGNGFSYQIGQPQFIVLLFAVIHFVSGFVAKLKKTSSDFLALLFLVETGIATFFLFKASAFLWKVLPLFSEINYPWTLLSQIGFLISLLAGFIATSNKNLKYAVLALAVIAVFLHLKYAKPESYVDRGDDFYVTNDATTTSSDELLPLWVKQKPLERYLQKVESEDGVQISSLVYNSKMTAFHIEAESLAKVKINTIYYPGWKVYANNKEMPINFDNNFGVIEFQLPKGAYDIKAIFSETLVRLLSNVISLAVFIIIFIIMASRKLKKLVTTLLYG